MILRGRPGHAGGRKDERKKRVEGIRVGGKEKSSEGDRWIGEKRKQDAHYYAYYEGDDIMLGYTLYHLSQHPLHN